MRKGEIATFTIENTYGMFILWAVGLGGSWIIAMAEYIYNTISVKRGINSVIEN